MVVVNEEGLVVRVMATKVFSNYKAFLISDTTQQIDTTNTSPKTAHYI